VKQVDFINKQLGHNNMSSISSAVRGGEFPPRVMSGASSRMSPTQKISDLFQKMDTSGSGSITSAQFAQSFQNMNPPQAFKRMGADSVFNQLSGNGTVSKQDFVDGMKKMIEQNRSQASGNAPSGTFVNSLEAINALNAAKSGRFYTTA
jgi:Ca2+-binding EF-hand superfamily protein